MRVFIFLTLFLFAVAQSQESPTGAEIDLADAEKKVGAAEETIENAVENTRKRMDEEKTACAEEIKGTQEWMDAVDEAKLKKMFERRMNDKKKLLGAVKDRIKVMEEYLAKLKLARGKLAGVITRVNRVFSGAYDEAVHAQKEATNIMALLGLSIGHTYNPGTEFAMIKLPKEDDEDASVPDTEPADGASSKHEHSEEEAVDCEDCEKNDAKLPSLMEVESKVHAKMARCKGKYCETAYHYAFDLYKSAHTNAQDDYKAFDEDKKIIANFRLVLNTLINRKIARLKNLTKQQADLEATLEAAEGESRGPLAKVLDDIMTHKKRIIDSCAVMGDRSKKMIAQFAALKSCVKGEECSASDTADEKASEKAKTVEAAPKEEESNAATASTGATGDAAGDASIANTKGGLENVFDSDASQ
jgi:hypothetical protein